VFKMVDGTKHEHTGEVMLAASRRARLLLEKTRPGLAKPLRGANAPLALAPPAAPAPQPPQPAPQPAADLPQAAQAPPQPAPQPARPFAQPPPAQEPAAAEPQPPTAAPPAAPPQFARQPPRIPARTWEPSPTSRPVTKSVKLKAGMPLQAEWGNQFFPAEVVDVLDDGTVKIHYVGWPDSSDEIVPRSRLRIEATELAKAQAAQPNASLGLRTWTDASGKFKVEAELLGVQEGKVRLKRPNGKEVTIPIDKLSAADREIARMHEAAPSAE
jgi:hypothetical protein